VPTNPTRNLVFFTKIRGLGVDKTLTLWYNGVYGAGFFRGKGLQRCGDCTYWVRDGSTDAGEPHFDCAAPHGWDCDEGCGGAEADDIRDAHANAYEQRAREEFAKQERRTGGRPDADLSRRWDAAVRRLARKAQEQPNGG